MRIAAVWTAVALIVAAVVILRHDDPSEIPAATGRLEIEAPRRLDAGAPMPVSVSGANPSVDSAQLVFTASAGSVSRRVDLRDGEGSLQVDASITRSAGVVEVWVIAGRDQAFVDVRIDAGAPVEPIVPLVGPKSIVADGEDHAMVVAVISDRYGNPVPTRSDAVLAARQPGNREAGGIVETTGLVVWRRVFSGTVAGRATITVSLGTIGGPVADLDEVAGRPTAIDVEVDLSDGAPFRADGRRLHRVSTGQIRDRHDNIVTDGTVVMFRVDEPTGRRLLTAPTIDGRAEARIEAPDVPGTLRVVASSSGVDSPPLTLDYGAAVDGIPTAVSEQGDRWAVDVGPVRMVDGGWIPDGTEIVVVRPGLPPLRALAVDGRARLESTSAPSPRARVVVLGVERSIR